MGSAHQSTLRANANQVIVHHLSDLNHEENTNSTNNKLLTYQRYLQGLSEQLYPDIVVITGNLTKTGTEQELRAVRDMLVAGFSQWEDHLHEHILIVPGPQDINWQWDNLDERGISLAVFYDIFKLFGTPSHAQKPDGRASGAVESEDWIGYLIDTCYSPDELDATLKSHFKTYAKDFGQFMKRRGRVGSKFLGMWRRPGKIKKTARNKARNVRLTELQKEFLTFTESTRPLDLRVGRVATADIDDFNEWAGSYADKVHAALAQATNTPAVATPAAPAPAAHAQQSNAPGTVGAAQHPLKILITHHPIIIRAHEKYAPAGDVVTTRSFTRLLKAAHEAGFHLALHGHHHSEDIVAEESTLQEPRTAKRIQQFGAASLAETGMFNEITAVYREAPGLPLGQSHPTGEWELNCLPKNLSAAGPVAPRGTPGNLITIADKTIDRLNRAAEQRTDFETQLQYAMRRFAEQVWRVRQEKAQGGVQRLANLPQESLMLLRDAISGVIFRSFETHVRLLLKSNEHVSKDVPRLVPTYLAPATMDGPDSVIYPASIAAWSLVLGRRLTYPKVGSETTVSEDHEWLRQSGKIDALIQALIALEQQARSTNVGVEAERFKSLYTSLRDIRDKPRSDPEPSIGGETMFRQTATKSPLRGWDTFICLPYPARPIGGTSPTLPEIAVLEVGVRPVEPPDPFLDTSPRPVGPFQPFTPERIEMLEVVTDVIGMMLTTADALSRPPGAWNENQW